MAAANRLRLSTPSGLVRAPDGRYLYGLQWAEERDLFEIVVHFRGPYDARHVLLQYWFLNWPHNPPRMPTIEDPVDDPWLGEWLTARTEISWDHRHCRFTFQPLEEAENKRAVHLPGVRYRHAVKFRLIFPPAPRPEVESLQVFSETALRPLTLLVQVRGKAAFAAHNGAIRQVKPVRGGLLVTVDVADPKPAGSHDVTVVEVDNGDSSFAFAPAEVPPGGVFIPDYDALITLEGDRASPQAAVKKGARTRERLALEPEQTYERATREIPPLDPVERQGGRLYLPLAADSSWQKFAFEWGGNVAISKRGTKAYGRELERLTWPGDLISWRIGAGAAPSYRPRSEDSTLAMLEDHLPVAIARWTLENIEYEEEAFATLLSGRNSASTASPGACRPASASR